MHGAYFALIGILMNGIWPVGLCCNYSPLIAPIHTTLKNAVMVKTLHQLFPIQTASTFDVLCVPLMQPRVATGIRKTLMSTCVSSFGRH